MADVQPTRIFMSEPMLLVGLEKAYTYSNMEEIPRQWTEFVPGIATVTNMIGNTAFGVVSKMDSSGFSYLSAVQVSQVENLKPGWNEMDLPTQTYAEFLHNGHVSTLSHTIDSIWKEWLPTSGKSLVDSPVMLEVYGEKFNPQTSSGEILLWIAIKS